MDDAAIPSRMKAGWYTRCGPAHEVLEVGEVETPRPGPGEVLVQIAVSGVNPHDTKKRAGWLTRDLPAARVVPHADAAGVIAAVGLGVPEARRGERVWVFLADAPRPGAGAAAEYALAAARHAVPLADHVGFDAGACLGIPALTAHRAVFAEGAVAGKTILVTGGAGSVAAYAIQFAAWNGARVLATISSPEKAARARAFGAAATIDYRTEDVARTVLDLTGGAGVDRIVEVDFGANVAVSKEVIAPGGVIAAYSSTRVREPVLPYYAFARKGVTLHFIQGLLLDDALRAKGLRDLALLLEQNRLTHPIGAHFPLERIADAHEALESGGVMGKVLVWSDESIRSRSS